MSKFETFVAKRLSYWNKVQEAKTISESWSAMIEFVKPCLPKEYLHYGDFDYFPPHLKDNEFMVIISNHQSDLDGHIAMALMNTKFIKREVKTKDDSSSDTSSSAPSTSSLYPVNPVNKIKPIAFTHDHFSKIPIVGSTIKKSFILLYSGITDEEIEKRVKQRIQEGYNTFILYPEGGIYDYEKDCKAQAFWEKDPRKTNQPYPFRNVFLPRFGCWPVLLRCLGDKLRYICDMTLLYPNYRPWEGHWNYDIKPSLIGSTLHELDGPVFTHIEIYDIEKQAEQTQLTRREVVQYYMKEETLMTLWLKKDKRLDWLRQKEIQYKE